MSNFPDHVDCIIVGTGLTNSILAAACSRIGKSVLHLDERSYYGNNEASFTFQQLVDWIKDSQPSDSNVESAPPELIEKSRMFCIDLNPKYLFSNGDMVDLLVKSNVARYHEFKNNIRILCLVGRSDIHVMPCRRNEVFTSPLLSNLADKRRLMKFIETCLKYKDEDDEGQQSDIVQVVERSEIDENADKPIGQYLEERGLKPTLREYIINSIAMIHPTNTTKEACRRIKKFMIATERYGRSPFLFPLYGCGEFPQSFCRMSAVFGGVYCLNTEIKEAKRHNSDEATKSKYSIKFGSEGQHCVTSDMLVVEQDDAIKLGLTSSKTCDQSRVSRAILITNKSIVSSSNSNQASDDSPQSSNDLISFLRIPPSSDDGPTNTVYTTELNSTAMVCPNGVNLVYMWTKATSGREETTAKQDLLPVVERLFADSSCILWQSYYHQAGFFSEPTRHEENRPTQDENSGLFITRPSFNDIDYTGIIKEAERLFKVMCPDQEFLPRAPDPDEIVHSE